MKLKSATEYGALSRYLDDRFAGVVVLRLSEIEDILGFKLPVSAHVEADWWANGASDQSTCWATANRTATPNLAARTVVFTRAEV